MFDGNTLTLIDFQAARPKQNIIIRNPSSGKLKGTFGHGAGFNPSRGCWNDTYALARTYQEIAPLLTLDPAIIQDDLTYLFQKAQKDKTIYAEFIVDDAWRQIIRPFYRKLRLRPWWLAKKSTRSKLRFIRQLLKHLLYVSKSFSTGDLILAKHASPQSPQWHR